MTDNAANRDVLTDRTVRAGHESLIGQRRGLSSFLPFFGPAVIASIAYVDPGNFATNIEAGAKYGYQLVWVVVLANAAAMLFQSLSARLGIVTGRNLAELCREHLTRRAVVPMWIVSEVGAMATDLAEFLGAALGLSLLFGFPIVVGMVLTGVVVFAVLLLQPRGFRPIELMIGALLALIGLCYVVELVVAPPDWRALALGAVVPRLTDAGAGLLAVGIVGATIMPHALYLHSGLTQDRVVPRDDRERRKLLRFSDLEVLVALGFAGLVNIAMLAMSATVFHDGLHDDVAGIESAYRTLVPLLGGAAAMVFLCSLIASGLSSSIVGTMAGQVIMQGFVGFRIKLWLRRLVTMVPSVVVVALGVDATQALVVSQVVLSFVLPVPLIALLILSHRGDIMGEFVSGRAHRLAAVLAAVVVIALDGALILQLCGVDCVG